MKRLAQPPSGGCVLKLVVAVHVFERGTQPPSGGCVLKPINTLVIVSDSKPAAFGRLCVETLHDSDGRRFVRQPPSGGCVLKRVLLHVPFHAAGPAAFGRLCVETGYA